MFQFQIYKKQHFSFQLTKLQMQSQYTKQEKSASNMTTYFKNLIVNFSSYMENKQPDKTDKDRFCKINSPKKFKLRSIKDIGLRIENDDWASNTTKDNTVQLHILNRSFNYTANIKKKQCIRFIFLLGEKYNDIIATKYNLL